MSGPTIGNWNKFDANVFKSISGVPDENTQRLEEAGKGGALGSRVADVKAGQYPPASGSCKYSGFQ